MLEHGVTAMNATLNLSRIAPGYYLLGIGLPDDDWSYSPLVIE